MSRGGRQVARASRCGAGPYGNLFQLTFNIHFCISSFEETRSLKRAPVQDMPVLSRYFSFSLALSLSLSLRLACTQLTHAPWVRLARTGRNYASYQNNYAFKSSKRCKGYCGRRAEQLFAIARGNNFQQRGGERDTVRDREGERERDKEL